MQPSRKQAVCNMSDGVTVRVPLARQNLPEQCRQHKPAVAPNAQAGIAEGKSAAGCAGSETVALSV